jgi:hypothetical protein
MISPGIKGSPTVELDCGVVEVVEPVGDAVLVCAVVTSGLHPATMIALITNAVNIRNNLIFIVFS